MQPHLRFGGDITVIARVHRLSGSGHAGHLPGTFTLRKVLANEPEQVTFTVDDMHRNTLKIETIVVVARSEMQLADGLDTVTALT